MTVRESLRDFTIEELADIRDCIRISMLLFDKHDYKKMLFAENLGVLRKVEFMIDMKVKTRKLDETK